MTDQPPSSITTPTPPPERTGVQATAHQVLGWLRVWLEIEPGAPWWMWLWRCFVLPPSPQRALRPWLLRPVRGLWAGLGWAMRFGLIADAPELAAYVARVTDRPACQRARALDDAAVPK